MPARREPEWDDDTKARARQLGREVRAERTRRGMSQEDFEQYGISRNTLSKIENGDLRGRSPRVRRQLEELLEWAPGDIDNRLRGQAGTVASEAQVVAAVEATMVRMLAPMFEALNNAAVAFRNTTSALQVYRFDDVDDDGGR